MFDLELIKSNNHCKQHDDAAADDDAAAADDDDDERWRQYTLTDKGDVGGGGEANAINIGNH